MTIRNNERRVWTTLITNDKYLTGLLTLDFSLKKVRSAYPLTALYTDGLSADALLQLEQRGIPAIKIDDLKPLKASHAQSQYLNDPRFHDCWSKLQSFSLYQFDKVVQLDSDMVVLKNMDELFEIELDLEHSVFAASHSCVCNPYKFDHYPKSWTSSNCAFTDYHSKVAHDSKIVNAGIIDGVTSYEGSGGSDIINDEVTHEILGPHPKNTALGACNGGLLVIRPDKSIYNEILETMKDHDRLLSYSFPDQDLLSDVFYNRWIGISYIYNYLKTLPTIHQDLNFANVKNIHYIITPKPWDVTADDYEDKTGTFKYWWDINDERLKFDMNS